MEIFLSDLTYPAYQHHQADELVDWLTSDTWPYHPHVQVDVPTVENWLASGMFDAPDNAVFWVMLGGCQKVGLIRIFELKGDTPLIDLRLWTPYRNHLIGRNALAWINDYIFDTYADKQAIAAVTRIDNQPMRRILRYCGYSRAGYHRKSWLSEYGEGTSVVCYEVEREAWLTDDPLYGFDNIF